MQVYAVIKAPWPSRPSETICASSQRHELVYSSLSNLVEIRVVAARSTDYFMMKIEGTAYTHIADTQAYSSVPVFRHILHLVSSYLADVSDEKRALIEVNCDVP